MLFKKIYYSIRFFFFFLFLFSIQNSKQFFEFENLSPRSNIKQIEEQPVFKTVFALWASGPEHRTELTFQMEIIGFKLGIIYPDSTYFDHETLKTSILESVMSNLCDHAKGKKYLYFTRETFAGMEVLVLDYGTGAIDGHNDPVHNLEKIFNSGFSYRGGGPAHGWGMTHLAVDAAFFRIGSMNDGQITVVEKMTRQGIGMFTKFTTNQKIYNLENLQVNKKGHGFFYHFFLRKNPRTTSPIVFSEITPENIFGVVSTSSIQLNQIEFHKKMQVAEEAALANSV